MHDMRICVLSLLFGLNQISALARREVCEMTSTGTWTYPPGWPRPDQMAEGEVTIVHDVEADANFSFDLKASSLSNISHDRHWWRACMGQSCYDVHSALYSLGLVEINCTLCQPVHSFEHCLAEKHFKRVRQFVTQFICKGGDDDYFRVRQEAPLIQVWRVPGGGIRYNHLDGMVEIFGGMNRQPPLCIPKAIKIHRGVPPYHLPPPPPTVKQVLEIRGHVERGHLSEEEYRGLLEHSSMYYGGAA